MRTRRLNRSSHDERGAVLIIFAVFVLVAVVMLAAVVDLGGQRQETRELTLSTDAAALAAAGLADTEDPSLTGVAAGTLVDCDQVDISSNAANPSGFVNVQAVVDDYLARNGDSQPVDCKVARTGFKTGYVVVSADEIVDYAFGPALGIQSGGVSGASVAAIEVDEGGGLRPIGICGAMQSLANVVGYPVLSLADVADNTTTTNSPGTAEYYAVGGTGAIVGHNGESSFTARFAIDKVKGGSCGGGNGGAGNFGQLDFGGDRSTSCDNNGHFCNDMYEGYDGGVDEDTKGETGANWSNTDTKEALDDLLLIGQFYAPIVKTYSDSGNNAVAELEYFVQLELMGYCVAGGPGGSAGTASPCQYSETGSASDNVTYFDFRVTKIVPFTADGPEATDDATAQPARLCAVENDAAQIAAGCPVTAGPTSTTSTPPPTVTTTTSTTTTTIPACVPGTPGLSPNPERKSGGSNQLKDNVTVTIPVDVTPCVGLSVRVVKQSDGSFYNATCCTAAGADYTGTISKSAFTWTPGNYNVNIMVNGVVQQTVPFSLT